MTEQTGKSSTNTIPKEDITRFGRLLGYNFATISDGRVFLVGREQGTRQIEMEQGSVLSNFFGNNVNAPNGHSKELAERIGESDYLNWWRKRDAMMPSNDAISSRDRNGLDIEDIVTYTTKERWDYMSRIASGDIKVMGFKRFQGGDFILVTDAGRMFYGRNGILEWELDRLTLREKRDEFIPATAFVGFSKKSRGGFKSTMGQARRNVEVKTSAPSRAQKMDTRFPLYAAIADVALNRINLYGYQGNGFNGADEILSDVQQLRDSFGAERALASALDYIARDMASGLSGNSRRHRQLPLQYVKLYLAMIDIAEGRATAEDYEGTELGGFMHQLRNAEHIKGMYDKKEAVGWVHKYMLGQIADSLGLKLAGRSDVRSVSIGQIKKEGVEDTAPVNGKDEYTFSLSRGLPVMYDEAIPKLPTRALTIYATIVGPQALVTFLNRR